MNLLLTFIGIGSTFSLTTKVIIIVCAAVWLVLVIVLGLRLVARTPPGTRD